MADRRFGDWCRSCAIRPALPDGLCRECAKPGQGYRVERYELEPLSRGEFHRQAWQLIEHEEAQ
jgi:hypothetical protein